MSLETYIVAAFAVVLTGISKSGFAGGLGILGVPLIALTMPPQQAATLLLPILLVIDILSVWRYQSAWQIRTIFALLPGATVGIGFGMAGFAQIDPDLLRIAIGVMALLFAARFVWTRSRPQTPASTAGWPVVFCVSALSGFAGFIAHAGGPPIKGTFLRMGLDKAAFVGTNAMFFFALNIAKAFGYATLGLLFSAGLLASVSLAPFLVLGVAIGFALHDRVPQGLFVKIAYVLLALAGLNLVGMGIIAMYTTHV